MSQNDLNSLVNLKYIEELTDGDHKALAHLVRVYLRETQLDLKKIEKSLVEGQRAEVQRLAHGCKGASGLYGITALVHPLDEMEHLAKDGHLHNIHPWLEEAKRLFARIEEGLESFLKTLPPSPES